MSKLRMPCPYCGGTDLEEVASFTYVICTTCRAEGPVGQAGKGMDAWNRRATQPADGEPVYQWRFRDDRYWIECSRKTFEQYSEAPHAVQTRTLYTAPPVAAHGDEAVRKDAERYRWLSQRDRFASVHTAFNNGGVYREHRIMWHVPGSWVEAKGEGLDAAIDAAMRAQSDGEVQ